MVESLIENVQFWQWILVIGSSLLLILIAPVAKTADNFFRGSKLDQQPGFWLLTSSLVISWLFAKSITNAANLGLEFGMVGTVAYAAYYGSFFVAGVIIYQLRTKGHFRSIHHFLRDKFGSGAIAIFSLLIAFRLLNEVWSNTMVIGTYFGASGSNPYYLSIIVFTILTAAYTLKGGLRSSLLTDLIQMVLFGVLLFVILGVILPEEGISVRGFVTSGSWTLAGGLNLFFVAMLQIFSYPFHDPVMTDRGFIGNPKTTLKSFIWAGIIGGLCIILFGWVGIYAQQKGLNGQAPVEVAKLLGVAMMLMINFIMITSAASTLDSAFNSFAKLWVIDLKFSKAQSVAAGRWAIVAIMIIGSIPVFMGAEILSATTVSGTMVIGLTPVFLFWSDHANRYSFYAAVGGGVILGTAYAVGVEFGNPIGGRYGALLWVNILGIIGSFLLYQIPYLYQKIQKR